MESQPSTTGAGFEVEFAIKLSALSSKDFFINICPTVRNVNITCPVVDVNKKLFASGTLMKILIAPYRDLSFTIAVNLWADLVPQALKTITKGYVYRFKGLRAAEKDTNYKGYWTGAHEEVELNSTDITEWDLLAEESQHFQEYKTKMDRNGVTGQTIIEYAEADSVSVQNLIDDFTAVDDGMEDLVGWSAVLDTPTVTQFKDSYGQERLSITTRIGDVKMNYVQAIIYPPRDATLKEAQQFVDKYLQGSVVHFQNGTCRYYMNGKKLLPTSRVLMNLTFSSLSDWAFEYAKEKQPEFETFYDGYKPTRKLVSELKSGKSFMTPKSESAVVDKQMESCKKPGSYKSPKRLTIDAKTGTPFKKANIVDN